MSLHMITTEDAQRLASTSDPAGETGTGASEAAWRALVEATPGLVFVTDVAGRNTYTNQRFQDYAGRPAAALLGAGWLATLHPDDRERAAAIWAASVRTGEPYEAEYRFLRADGDARWHLVRAAPQRDLRTGQIEQWVGTCTDIDDRHRAEATNARLAAIVAASNDAVISFAVPDGRILTWNKAAEALFGYTAEEAIGRGAGLLVPPELPEGDASGVFRWALEGRLVQEHETVRLTKDGERVPVAVTAARLLASDERVLGVSATFRDLRARRAAEAASRVAEARARLALRAGGLVPWEVDSGTGRLVAEEGLAALFGVPTHALDGTMQPFVARIHPEDRERVLAEFAPAAAAGGSYRAEFRVLPEPGEEQARWLLGAGEGVVGPDGCVRVVGYNADITAAKRDEAALREAVDAKEALLAEVNHRVKNSLQLVSSLLVLQASRTRDASTRAVLNEARDRISVVARLHQRLYHSGLHNTVDAAALLRELCADTSAALASGGDARVSLAFAESAGADALFLPIDKAVPLALIAFELLTNALKYAYPTGEPGGRVRLSLRSEGKDDPTPGPLVMLVEDDGVGLPEGFEPAASRGVGMKVVTALARQLRATLTIRRGAAGRGAEFELRMVGPEAP